jgi:PKD repeat protein
MARINARCIRRHLPGPVLAALAAISVLAVGPVTAAAASTVTTVSPVPAALTQAFEAARHIPGSAIAGIRAGTMHTGTADGTEWAIASFTPSASASKQLAAGFQDGAATGVFSNQNGQWRLVKTGLYGCGVGLPATLKKAWGLVSLPGCTSSIATQRAAAQRALSAFPAPVAAAASAAVSGHAARAATSPADLGQTIASIALTQVGVSVTPVVPNFNTVDCDPYSTLAAGFSASSDGCGYDNTFGVRNENETWCSDFNKWVWEQAGVTTDMNAINAGAVSFYDWAVDQGQTPQIDTGTPQVGDSIVFFSPGNFPGFADHVGIVTSVSPDGTIDMVNGDFAATPAVHVEYDTGITNLTSFAASVEGPGEEWVIVAPPTTAQQPVPTATLSGPHVAVAGATGRFHAQGSEQGGSITGYYWTFGDGRTTNSTGPDVTHVYSEAGTYTATVTVTSSFGTITTLTQNVTVLGASSAVAAVPSDAVWFATTPVDEYMFVRSAGGLAADTWDGASWLQAAVPGQPSATGGIAALGYPDPAAADAMTPHAYFRAADGSLAQTYLGASGWVTQELPGHPAANSNIVAATTATGGPAVFYIDAGGNLAESSQQSGGWVTSTLLTGSPVVSPASLTLADTASGPVLFAVGPAGTIRSMSERGGIWSSRGIPARTSRGGSLAALTTPDGRAAVVYADVRGGGLAEAAETSGTTAGTWNVTGLPGSPAPGSSLAAANYLLPSAVTGSFGSFPQPPGSLTPSGPAEPLGTEAFYLTASGAPGVTFYDGTGWQTAALPGTGDAITGASAYPVAYQPMQLFLSSASGGLAEDSTSGAPSGTWTAQSLPGAPATFADRVVLYAATSADDTAALGAAAAAGLPASQVTTSFATAWDDTLSGSYLVISVGLAATDGLYFNVCGWANPSTDIPGSTPFYFVSGPWNTLPGAGAFENGAASTAALSQQRVTDLAYYAVHGTLPSGVTSVPAYASPEYACSGSPS